MAEDLNKLKKKICIGDKVYLEKNLKGEVRFIGNVSGKSADIRYGIKLTEPKGKNNGCINNIRYFNCKHAYGLFVKRSKIKKSKETEKQQYKFLPRVEIGDKVSIINKKLNGIIRFIGIINFKTNEILYGIQLSTAKGSSNGNIDGKQYFECEDMYGTFINGNEIVPMLIQTKIKNKKSKKKKNKIKNTNT
eukprot:96022_1